MAFTPKPRRRQDKRDRARGQRSISPYRFPKCGCARVACRACPEGGRRQGESPLAYAKRVYRAWLGRAYYGTGTKKRAPLTVARARLARQQARFTRMRDEALTVMTWGAVPYPVWGVIPAPLDALTQAAQLDGGIPPLLEGFVRQMDRGRQADELRHRGEMFTATADEVAAVIEQLRSSGNKTTKGRFAILRFFQFREIHPDLPDWCDEQGLHERTAYREVNRAVSAVWKYLVSRKRGYR